VGRFELPALAWVSWRASVSTPYKVPDTRIARPNVAICRLAEDQEKWIKTFL
jgi:hypothetical protein